MQTLWALWVAALAVIMALATWMEYNALLRRIDGANGLVLLTAGVAGVLSLPVGGAVAWYFAGLAAALKMVLITGAGLGTTFGLSLYGLDAYAKRQARRR